MRLRRSTSIATVAWSFPPVSGVRHALIRLAERRGDLSPFLRAGCRVADVKFENSCDGVARPRIPVGGGTAAGPGDRLDLNRPALRTLSVQTNA